LFGELIGARGVAAECGLPMFSGAADIRSFIKVFTNCIKHDRVFVSDRPGEITQFLWADS
jgi:hypothetical protein